MVVAIDEPTLVTVLGLASLTSSGLFFALAVVARHIPGVRYWAFGAFAVALAMIIDGPRIIDDWRFASLLFNIPFSMGQACMLAGTMQFCARPNTRRIFLALFGIAIFLTVVFTFIHPHDKLRITSLSVYQVIINVWTAMVLWRHADSFSRPVFAVAGVSALLQAAASFTQGALVLESSIALSYASPELPLANIISWAGALLNTLIGNSMLFLLIMMRLVSDLKAAAERDVLTGLLNRRGMRLHFDRLLSRTQAERGSIAIMLLDIDHFKSVNDTHGHDMGDRVLQVMGQVLLNLGLPNTTPARWGGEEFCVVVEGTNGDAVTELAETIRSGFREGTAAIGVLSPGRTVSVGIALAEMQVQLDLSSVISSADAQLYRAKLAGRDRVALAA